MKNKMRLILTFLIIIFLVLINSAGQANPPVKASELIPRPLHCVDRDGFFSVSPGITISSPSIFAGAAGLLGDRLTRGSYTLVKSRKKNGIVITRATGNHGMAPGEYELNIAPGAITITAAKEEGVLNAVFSLLQLQLLQPDMSQIPCAEIRNAPRFAYRGMHLDVSRNFYPVSFIKKFIDLMALYKYNTFHWHLTDGPGWRLEIKKYPLLTSQAAFRTHKTWQEWWKTPRRYSHEGHPNAYGGYYTQDDAREIVAYAAQRGIAVIPEIEMPGHSEALLTVYPELSCPGEPYASGEFCIGNPDTYVFLENVLAEVMEIFPSEHIHIGGDEAGHHHWKNCAKCQSLKEREGLKDEYELQAYLIRHFSRFLKLHGRKLIGWDEIVDGGLPEGATIMDWRGANSGIKAAKQGLNVIMTPGTTYFDYYQSDPLTQPKAIGGYLPITRVYSYDPIPAELPGELEKYYLGTQANLWTEYMPNSDHVEYMAYPRALALAEVAWSKREYRDFDDFHRRLQSHYLLLQRLNVNYYRPSTFLTVVASPDLNKQQNLISFESEQYKPEIRYTLDGTGPVATSSLYTGPFYTSGKTMIRAVIFENGEPAGETSNYTAHYHKAIGRKVTYGNPWCNNYPARGRETLTNGIHGSLTYQDNEWMGFLRDIDLTIDMEEVQPISSVSLRFMQQPGPGVHLPGFVELQFSDNGTDFVTFGKLTHDNSPENVILDFETFRFDCQGQPARYIRLLAPNVMRGYMFVDEIVVY